MYVYCLQLLTSTIRALECLPFMFICVFFSQAACVYFLFPRLSGIEHGWMDLLRVCEGQSPALDCMLIVLNASNMFWAPGSLWAFEGF